MEIKNAVGKGALLKGPDVGIIQTMINTHFRKNKAYKEALKANITLYKPIQALKVDNDCGESTLEAIKQFQKTVLKWKSPGVKIDPGGITFRALSGNVTNAKHIVKLSGKYVQFNQRDYPNTKIGNSTSYTIKSIGCTLTSLTMAATAIGSPTTHWPKDLFPKELTPTKANDILKSAGAFRNGGEMVVKDGANALVMRYEEYGRKSNLTSQDLTLLKSHLGKGYPVIAHVDYKDSDKAPDDSGDHWILLVRTNSDGTISAIDPAFGGEISLKTTANENSRYKDTRAKQKPGVLFGYKGNQDKNAGPKTKKGQQKYIVVRFGLLSSLHEKPGMCLAETLPLISVNSSYGGFSLVSLMSIQH